MANEELSKSTTPELIPASMLAAYAYCPRLCYLQWVAGEFMDSAEIVEGRFLHLGIDAAEDAIPEDFRPFHARSVSLSAPEAGICCRIDLLECDGSRVTPVEYKRGEAQKGNTSFYEPHLIQLAAQCLALQENGFSCDEGIVYYIRSNERVFVKFSMDLLDRAREMLDALRKMADKGEMPPPLQSSTRCDRCSLAGICMPDEVIALQQMEAEEEARLEEKVGKKKEVETEPKRRPADIENIRRLLPPLDNCIPIFVIGQGHIVRKRGERLEIWSYDGEKVSEARIREVSKVCLYGGVEITTPAMMELMQRNIPVLHFSHGGWYYGICQGMSHKNVSLRIKQFEWAGDEVRSLQIASSLIAGKIENCRTLVHRNYPDAPAETLESMERLANEAQNASSMQSLLGLEGAAAEAYFGLFGSMLKVPQEFRFEGRTRRPPRDPVNSVLSYLYSILTKELFTAVLAVGFDPYLGFYHQPRYGRPALALDMMEEFRPIVADSIVLTLFNSNELEESDFIKTGIGISMTPEAKKKVLAGYERRMQTEIEHPIFGYRISYRRVLDVQARLLSRVLMGELKRYTAFVTR